MDRSGSASEAELRFSSLDAEMRGVSDTAAMRTHVPGVLPGELARVRIDHVDRRGTRYGTLLRVLEHSRDRVEPSCVRFLDCSGCDLLHAPYAIQLEAKRARVVAALGFDAVEATVPSPRLFGYRALAKLVVGPGGVLGSYRARSHDVADMQGCVVHAQEAEAIVDAIRTLPLAGVRYVLVRASLAEKRAIVVLVTRDEDPRAVDAIARALEPRDDVAGVYHHVNASTGDELLGPGPHRALFEKCVVHETIGALRYALEPGAFAQVNPLAAAQLYARAVDLAAPKDKRVLDLYSGSAGLALAFARAGASEVVAVESSAAAIRAGERSAAINGARIRFVHARAEEAPLDPFDLVVLNPPRKGASREVLERIAKIKPAQLIYVSCNPDTLARDLALLEDYALTRAIPVDLFPHTRHVETIALALRRPEVAQ